MQENSWTFCSIDPIMFWKYTPAETSMMISASVEKYNSEMKIRSSLEARLCAVVLNANGATKKNKKPYEMEDFMPVIKKEKQHFTPEQLEQIAKAACMKMGGDVEYKI